MVDKLALVSLALLALLLFSGTYALVSAEPTEDNVVECLPGSVEQWSNPLNEDGSRIWHYEETDKCEVNVNG